VRVAAADHTVDALAEQVDVAVAAAELDHQLRVPREELRQRRRQHVPPRRRRHVDPQPPARAVTRAPEPRLELPQLAQQPARLLEVHRPVRRQRRPPRRAVQQLDLQPRLEPLHRRRHARLRDPQRLPGLREAAELGHPDEHLHRAQSVQFRPPLFGDPEQ
jgi:hypothetical protein